MKFQNLFWWACCLLSVTTGVNILDLLFNSQMLATDLIKLFLMLAFLCFLCLFAYWLEVTRPRRYEDFKRRQRWPEQYGE